MSPQESKQQVPWLDPNYVLIMNTGEIEQSEFPLETVVRLATMGIFIDHDFYILRKKKDFFNQLIEDSNQ